MTKFYSATKKAFYAKEIHDVMPNDVVEITEDEYNSLFEGQASGGSIQPDENGKPIVVFPPPLTLQQKQDTGWTKIKRERDRRQASGVKVGDKWFHTDMDSRIKYLGIISMGANVPSNLEWKTMDGSFVTMTQDLIQQVFAAVTTYDTEVFANAEAHKAVMLESVSPEAYDFSTGWPDIYVAQ